MRPLDTAHDIVLFGDDVVLFGGDVVLFGGVRL